MANISVTNRTIGRELYRVTAEDHVQLKHGNYLEPVILTGKTGTADRPIFIEPDPANGSDKVTFKSTMSKEVARKWANKVAGLREKNGHYPSVGQTADQAQLILRNCQFVVIQGLNFEDCWPGGIYLDECQHIIIHDVYFEGGTIAIGINGRESRDIVIQDCIWQQDVSSDHEMWNSVHWSRIHGASDNSARSGADEDDYRHWDGDFIRGWDAKGNITIRRNIVSDAFNGVHFFNSTDRLAPGVDPNMLQFNLGRSVSSNIVVEDNTFVRVRDNVFEPEDHAWNWVVRHNMLKDCYRPFSFELERAGWFYIYGNTGSFAESPSTQISDEDEKLFPGEARKTFSVFKPKGTQANEGPIHVFNNSWYLNGGKGIFPKFSIGHLSHANNAVKFGRPDKGRMFGNDGAVPGPIPSTMESEELAERRRFTRRWTDYRIWMDGDVGDDQSFPGAYRAYGYAIGQHALNGDPSFVNPDGSGGIEPDFSIGSASPAHRTSIPISLQLPNGTMVPLPGGHNRGAVQSDGVWEKLDPILDFVPDLDWMPELKNPDAGGRNGFVLDWESHTKKLT